MHFFGLGHKRDAGMGRLHVGIWKNEIQTSKRSNATGNYDSCFVEFEYKNSKNVIVGVVYRSHTSIDNFIRDIDPVFKVSNQEKKQLCIMGDFNMDIDLLRVESLFVKTDLDCYVWCKF